MDREQLLSVQERWDFLIELAWLKMSLPSTTWRQRLEKMTLSSVELAWLSQFSDRSLFGE